MSKEEIVYVALNNIRSLYNVGSIFRTSDALGVNKIILGGYTGAPPRKEIEKTALGAQDWVAYEKTSRLPKRIGELKKEGFQIVGLENNVKDAIPISIFFPSFPVLLVLGNELRGISKAVRKELDEIVFIPMVGKKESLNVSVAFGIAAYHIKNNLKTQNSNVKI